MGTAALLLLALSLAFYFDAALDRWVVENRTPNLERAAQFCSRFLAWHWLMAGAVLGLLAAWFRQRRDWMRVLCTMAIAASIAGLSADLVRGLTGRTRPYAPAAQGWYGVRNEGRWLIGKHAYNSFPSGHTSAITGFAVPLFLWRRRLGLVAFPIILIVASARIYLSVHHLSDVIAGMFLGTLVATLVWRRLRPDPR